MSFRGQVSTRYRVQATEDWPYFHVTNFTDTPSASNLYLGIKGKKYSTSSYAWDRMKYFWSAQLKPNLKLYTPKEDWDLGAFKSAAKKIGFDASFMTTSNDSDIVNPQPQRDNISMVFEQWGSIRSPIDREHR